MAKNKPCDAPSTLNKKTLQLVLDEPKGLLAVAVKTQVPIWWLRKFAAGKIQSPSVNRVQFVYEKLSGSKIKTT